MDYTKKGLGWSPDVPDIRDHEYVVSARQLKAVPTKIDLRKLCPAVYDQGQLGSCTAQSILGMYQMLQKKQQMVSNRLSALFLYYFEREREGTVMVDSGAMLRTGMKVINELGCAREQFWRYDISAFRTRPSQKAITQALDYQAVAYQRLERRLDILKACLAEGYPFIFGFPVYESFYQVGKNGKVAIPQPSEAWYGGHAVIAVGYDNKAGHFIVRNSWGKSWGDKGYCYMPYSILTDMSWDFWTMRLVEGKPLKKK